MTITDHAYDRAKERCGLNKSAFERILQKAVEQNITHKNTKGNLNKYITSKIMAYRIKATSLIFDKYIFIVAGSTVITVYQIPQSLLPIKKYLKD